MSMSGYYADPVADLDEEVEAFRAEFRRRVVEDTDRLRKRVRAQCDPPVSRVVLQALAEVRVQLGFDVDGPAEETLRG